jgi:hypothetical protein
MAIKLMNNTAISTANIPRWLRRGTGRIDSGESTEIGGGRERLMITCKVV